MTMAAGYAGGKAVRVIKRGKVAITGEALDLRRLMWAKMRREGYSDVAIGSVFDRSPRHVRREIRAFEEEEAGCQGQGEEGRARRRTA